MGSPTSSLGSLTLGDKTSKLLQLRFVNFEGGAGEGKIAWLCVMKDDISDIAQRFQVLLRNYANEKSPPKPFVFC